MLKNIILAYELSGTRRAATLDFTQMWNTFRDLRIRGQLFDPRAYYRLLNDGKLIPEVVDTIEDACVELDGLLRIRIFQFRQAAASMLWNSSSHSLVKDHSRVKEGLQKKLLVMFTYEELLRENLWAAVEETIDDMKDSSDD